MNDLVTLSRRAFLAGTSAFLAGCAVHQVSYQPIPRETASRWSVADVRVLVPDDLVVDQSNVMLPSADIVWYGAKPDDRRAHVAQIVKAGVAEGVKGLRGDTRVVLDIQLIRFHALTPTAYFKAPQGTGVHGIGFLATVRDAKTGAVLHGPERIEADMPARTLADEPNQDAGTYTRREEAAIRGQIGAVIRGWLGLGPDIRGSFSRMGK